MHKLARKYLETIRALSRKTGSPVSSLATSFIILHEATAILPFCGLFFIASSFELGQTFVKRFEGADVIGIEQSGHASGIIKSWMHKKVSIISEEGYEWVAKVGDRYRIFGQNGKKEMENNSISHKLSGEAANALVAYILTKV
jgi:hypothetical protein